MAYTLKVNDVLEVRFVCRAATQFAYNVRHFRVSALGGGAPTLSTAVLAMSAKFAPLFKALLSQTATFYGIGVKVVVPTATLEETTKVGSGAGLVAGDLMATQVASVFSLRTDLPGKRFRGRMYVPFPSETDNDVNARPIATYLAAANALLTPLITEQVYTNGADTFSAKGTLYHRALKTETTLTAGLIRTDWGTQRRRSQINRPDRIPF